jgi:hypothetical protein
MNRDDKDLEVEDLDPVVDKLLVNENAVQDMV